MGSDTQPNVLVRFFSKVDINEETGCWEWTAATNDGGYGRFSLSGSETTYAHRWIYEQVIGAIRPGYVIDHLCANPRCVNPRHLEAVENHINISRANREHLIARPSKPKSKRVPDQPMTDLERILFELNQQPAGLSRRQLCRLTTWKANRIQRALDTLHQHGYVLSRDQRGARGNLWIAAVEGDAVTIPETGLGRTGINKTGDVSTVDLSPPLLRTRFSTGQVTGGLLEPSTSRNLRHRE